MAHGCSDCTHLERYKSDLLATGAALDGRADGVANDPSRHGTTNDPPQEEIPDQSNLLFEPRQEQPPADGRRGYARLASMDGKTITRKICAVTVCKGDLVNYKKCPFPESSASVENKQPGDPDLVPKQLLPDQTSTPHFHPLMVLKAQTLATPSEPGRHIVYRIQWTCGYPIGWGRCYTSESSSQVLEFINQVWAENPESKPGFIAYDDACSLLRHIVTQNPQDPWLATTVFRIHLNLNESS
ncbi:hypothetical protein B0H19DRAFT_1077227 [Mycena capillaripes]|nr:hypothetical protein B0H19DRAFT_1077227 [Mycena capillaripes]